MTTTKRTQPSVKTVPTPDDVGAFVAAVADDVRRRDAETLVELMARATGQPPVLWGPSIVGFGSYHYVYESGREGDASAVGFSPRKASTTVYLADGFDAYTDDLARLGPHSLGKSCLYLKDLSTVDLAVLEGMVRRSYEVTTTRTWPAGQ
ncbi:DUF1801 domain-containing protein [Cellulomonas sp. ATA003]|uniref:DUF1801 domain-containing protein n=1 Tax=Cellulomonas sp. ATA003 TaxID=3073064 RepID=UPI002872EC37|nr:DUF1801 domain-containing protein [Cellulomonas sp. ATA003]WNB84430.1 DUF1801 domain-containing protein [Cellulomonas sp. ATA003]